MLLDYGWCRPRIMKSLSNKLGVIVLLIICGIAMTALGESEVSGAVVVLEINGTIGPATGDYIERSLEKANQQQAELVVIRMDTPGGLDTSMRIIIKQIAASTVPVAGFVAPSGARAASAGTYILYASHIAAMAPGTNLGAATPVQIGGLPGGDDNKEETQKEQTEKEEDDKDAAGKVPGGAKNRKLVNDAAAYLRSLAQMRGRNADWAEKAVREAVSLPAEEALRIGVIDLVATDLQDLLRQVHGRTVTVKGRDKTLSTENANLVRIEPDWRNRLLSVISNPNIAYVLMLIGVYGLIYEFSNPGAILPGTVGAISLVLALFAFQALPVNYAGVALILIGLALMIGEAFVPSFGVLGLGGMVAFIIGSVILIDTEAPGYGISLPLIVSLAVVTTLTLVLLVGMVIKFSRRPVVSGGEGLIGARGLAIGGFARDGSVRVHGEVWRARTDRSLQEGQSVRVTGREGLTLLVTPASLNEEET